MRKDQHNYDHIWPRPRWDTVSKNFCTLSANESCQQSTGGKSCTSNGWDWKSMSKVKRPTNVSCHYWHEYTLQLKNIWAFNPINKSYLLELWTVATWLSAAQLWALLPIEHFPVLALVFWAQTLKSAGIFKHFLHKPLLQKSATKTAGQILG